ncbi:transcription termination/antitermination NusG family protein [Erwinia amylovora]|uniref:transcription termination/antitermination NusG family protein n=1 Tax=Erwinia amylovora TaxID=552 RepID=UPI0014446A26|nr:transcription termination/antitermination NusG family protein [Erwinia amylovora]
MKNWYVLAFTSNKFGAVERFLKLNKIEFLCPMQEHSYSRPDKSFSIRKSLVPTFPGYLFVYLDFNETHPEKLARFQYIYGLITFSNAPMAVPEVTIQVIADTCSVVKTVSSVKKIISHDFAAILLTEEPKKRSVMLLNYLCENHSQSVKEVKYAS